MEILNNRSFGRSLLGGLLIVFVLIPAWLGVPADSCAALITTNPFANDGGQRDYGTSGSFSVFSDPNDYTPVGVNSIWGDYLERRLALEFDLSGIPDDALINSATLSIHTSSFGGGPQRSMDMYVGTYSGDGAISSSDFNQTGNAVGGPYHYDLDDHWSERPPNPLEIDVTSALPTLMGLSDYAGVLLWHEGAINGSFSVMVISTLMDEGSYGSRYPTLTVDYETSAVPVPSALWLLGSGIVGLASLRRRKGSREAHAHRSR